MCSYILFGFGKFLPRNTGHCFAYRDRKPIVSPVPLFKFFIFLFFFINFSLKPFSFRFRRLNLCPLKKLPLLLSSGRLLCVSLLWPLLGSCAAYYGHIQKLNFLTFLPVNQMYIIIRILFSNRTTTAINGLSNPNRNFWFLRRIFFTPL